MEDSFESCWLLAYLREQRADAAEAVARLRTANDEAWRGRDPGWFFAADTAHVDRVVQLVAAFLAPCRPSMTSLLPAETVAAMLGGLCLRGLGLARALAAGTPATWDADVYSRLEREALALDAASVLEGADPDLRRAIEFVCRAANAEAVAALSRDAAACALRTPSGAPWHLPVAAALLDAFAESDRVRDRTRLASLDGLPRELALRHATARGVHAVALEPMPDGKLRVALRLRLPAEGSFARDVEHWLERDIGRRVRPVEAFLRAHLPPSCRLATMPVCGCDAVDPSTALPESGVVAALATEVARSRVVARPAVWESLATFVQGNGAGAAMVQDACGHDSDFPEIAAAAERVASAAGVAPIVHLDLAAEGIAPTLADLLFAVAAGVGLELKSGQECPAAGFVDEQEEPGGAGSPATQALAERILAAGEARGLVVLLNVCRLRHEELYWLGQHVIGPLLAAKRPALRFVLHGRRRVHNRPLLDYFPGAFEMVGDLAPFTREDLQEFLAREAGYPPDQSAERARRALQLTEGRPRNARVLLQTAMYGQAW